LQVYITLLDLFEQKNIVDPKKKLEFLNSFSSEVVSIITSGDFYSNANRESNALLRQFFLFYSIQDEYLNEGLKFFSKFSRFITTPQFNSIKAFLFYYAYQTHNYSTKEVKELLNQLLLSTEIIDSKTYLDFCMYCFYRGLYLIENKDYFLASFFYSSAVTIGLRLGQKGEKLLNGFNCQMIRSLCFLKFLTKFNISKTIFNDTRFHRDFSDYLLIDHQDVSFCLDFIKENKTDIKAFNEFKQRNLNNINDCKLKGLMRVAEEEIIFNEVKKILKVYKRTRMAKIVQITQINFNDIVKMLKKKVLNGEIDIKYDESEDIIEVFDLDPGKKERVEKTKKCYEKIIEGNKNLFMSIKNNKLDELNGKTKNIKNDIAVNLIENEYFDQDMMMQEEFDE
jgi:hypothetical protein